MNEQCGAKFRKYFIDSKHLKNFTFELGLLQILETFLECISRAQAQCILVSARFDLKPNKLLGIVPNPRFKPNFI